jgi:hypothetical protein
MPSGGGSERRRMSRRLAPRYRYQSSRGGMEYHGKTNYSTGSPQICPVVGGVNEEECRVVWRLVIAISPLVVEWNTTAKPITAQDLQLSPSLVMETASITIREMIRRFCCMIYSVLNEYILKYAASIYVSN